MNNHWLKVARSKGYRRFRCEDGHVFWGRFQEAQPTTSHAYRRFLDEAIEAAQVWQERGLLEGIQMVPGKPLLESQRLTQGI